MYVKAQEKLKLTTVQYLYNIVMHLTFVLNLKGQSHENLFLFFHPTTPVLIVGTEERFKFFTKFLPIFKFVYHPDSRESIVNNEKNIFVFVTKKSLNSKVTHTLGIHFKSFFQL